MMCALMKKLLKTAVESVAHEIEELQSQSQGKSQSHHQSQGQHQSRGQLQSQGRGHGCADSHINKCSPGAMSSGRDLFCRSSSIDSSRSQSGALHYSNSGLSPGNQDTFDLPPARFSPVVIIPKCKSSHISMTVLNFCLH